MTFIISVTIFTILTTCVLCKSIKEYQEEKRRRHNHYHYLNPVIPDLLRTVPCTDVAVTIVKDKRQLVILKNTLSKPITFGDPFVNNSLIIFIDYYKEPELTMMKDCFNTYYKLRLPIHYTGNIDIPLDFNLYLFFLSLKNSNVTYVENYERRVLNEL